MTIEELLEECDRRAMALISQGAMLKEFDIRLIARQVIKEALEEKTDENQ